MTYYNVVTIKDINLTKAFNVMKKLPEDFVSAYILRNALQSCLDDLDKGHSVNEVLQHVMKRIDKQIRAPEVNYKGRSNDELAAARQNLENGAAWK